MRLPALLVVLVLTAAPTPAPRAAQSDRSAPLVSATSGTFFAPEKDGQRANVIGRDNAGNLIQFFGK